MPTIKVVMIITTKENNISRSEQFVSKSCTIDAGDMRYIARLLRNNYSDTILATMREIIANALDVSVDRKPQVTLPTRLKPDFIVRDFGVGLSEDEMLGLYTKYGKSTKRGSNNAIGGFGIGRFAPLSYTSSFIVISVNNSIKTSYSILIDENDDTVVTKLISEKTQEPNGIYVQVPIADSDIRSFNSKFAQFSFYLKDSLEIVNSQQDLNVKMGLSCDLFDLLDLKGGRWGGYVATNDLERGPHVLMGGILYPVKEDSKWKAFCSGIIYKGEIGEFELHHGREQLEYSNKTKQALSKASDAIHAKFFEMAESEIKDCQNLYEAKKKVNQFVDSYIHRIKCDSSPSFSYKGQKISGTLFPQDHFNKERSYKVAIARRGYKLTCSKIRYYDNIDLKPEENDRRFYVVDDEPTPRGLFNRLSWVKGENSVILIKPASESHLDKLKELVETCNHPNFSLLSNHQRTVRKSGGDVRKSGGSKIASGSILSFKTERAYNEADHWELPTEEFDDSKTYYYVRYHSNKVRSVENSRLSFCDDSPINMKNFIYWAHFFLGDIKIYGVRGNSIEKVKKMKNWIPFEKLVEDKMRKSQKLIDAIKANKLIESLNIYGYMGDSLIKELGGSKKASDILVSFVDLFGKVHHDLKNYSGRFIPESVSDEIGISAEEKIIENFKAKFPLHEVILNSARLKYNDQTIKAVNDYFLG